MAMVSSGRRCSIASRGGGDAEQSAGESERSKERSSKCEEAKWERGISGW
jgi:hypothetical protein